MTQVRNNRLTETIDLVFASNNDNKVKEIRALFGDMYKIGDLKDIGCMEDIPETKDTIEGNASQKAYYVFEKFGINCFSDDTGLEIRSLNGAPGVFSARYAGEQKNANSNMNLVLKNMQGVKDRHAQFKTVISLIMDGKEKQFTGILEGEILNSMQGNKGFGYDPIFKPQGSAISLAEMNPSEKNAISHRAIAVKKLVSYLLSLRA
jgi:XTP/dITP diphosphohydrolase